MTTTNTPLSAFKESANPQLAVLGDMDIDQAVKNPSNDDRKKPESDKEEQASPENSTFEKEWGHILPIYLNELLRLEAPVEKEEGSLYCETCNVPFSDDPEVGLYRCIQCNTSAECVACLFNRHKRLPLHTVQQWTGQLYEEMTLRSLGLVHQLGHRGGVCPTPSSEVTEMTVLDETGTQTVAVQFCDCGTTHGNYPHAQQLLGNLWYPMTASHPTFCTTFGVFETFRALNDACGITINQFLIALKRPNTQVEVKDVEEGFDPDSFETSLRGYTTIMQAKNFGDYLTPKDAPANPSIVMCWACPHEGLNIPRDSRQFIKPQNQHLFTLMLALESRSRRQLLMKPDPPHGQSLAQIQTHLLADSTAEERKAIVSTCQTHVRRSKPRVSSEDSSGTIVSLCARHDIVRPRGLGSYMNGETLREADKTFLSSVQDTHFEQINVSYDAACVWENHFRERLVEYPNKLQLDPNTKVEFQLPHRCKPTPGPIPSDCPGRNWAHPDGKRSSGLWSSLRNTLHMAKTLSDGAQTDWIIHGTEYYNATKNLALGQTLLDRLSEAEDNYSKSSYHVANIEDALDAQLKETWNRDLPFSSRTGSVTYPPLPAMIRPFSRHFNKAGIDTENIRNWPQIRTSPGGKTMSLVDFVAFGIQIEDIQRQVAADPTPDDRLRSVLADKLEKFRLWQAVQMPDAFQTALEGDASYLPAQPELVKLWLPSQLPAPGNLTMLGEIELALRFGQCKDALEALVMALLEVQWNTHLPTEAQTIAISYAKTCAAIYKRGQVAIADLNGDLTGFPDLSRVDVTQQTEDFSSSDFIQQVIYLTSSPDIVRGEFKQQLDEYTQIMWTRAIARRIRWAEEIAFVKEDMKRTLRFLASQANWWDEQAERVWHNDRTPRDLMLGQQGHALGQTAFLRKVSAVFKSMWSSHIDIDDLYVLPA